jgi:hypothetical protein
MQRADTGRPCNLSEVPGDARLAQSPQWLAIGVGFEFDTFLRRQAKQNGGIPSGLGNPRRNRFIACRFRERQIVFSPPGRLIIPAPQARTCRAIDGLQWPPIRRLKCLSRCPPAAPEDKHNQTRPFHQRHLTPPPDTAPSAHPATR